MARQFFRSKLLLKVIVLAVFVSFFVFPATNAVLKNFFYTVSAPFQKFFWHAGAGVSNFLQTITNLKNLNQENEELKKKNQELLGQVARLEEQKKENESLRTALGIEQEKGFILMLAEVVSKDIGEDAILINRGTKNELSLGLPVLTDSGILLGRVSEVSDHFSKVLLVSSKESSFNAKIQGKDIFAMAKGKGNFQLFLDLIPKGKDLREGDLAVTAALGGIFPEGIVVGEITKIRKNDIEPFDQAEIKPAFEINQLSHIFVVIDY